MLTDLLDNLRLHLFANWAPFGYQWPAGRPLWRAEVIFCGSRRVEIVNKMLGAVPGPANLELDPGIGCGFFKYLANLRLNNCISPYACVYANRVAFHTFS